MNVAAVVVIPVYNHGTTLRGVVENALRFHPDVLVVDDGSTDNGPESLTGLPVRLLRLACNQGKGAALLAGARATREAGATHIICLDADAQHDPAEIPAFLAEVRAYPHAVIVGERDFSVPGVPVSSRFGRAFSGFWMRVQTGLRVSDMQSGFRAYPLAVLACLQLSEKRYAFEVEVLVKAAWAGFAIREIPVRVYYPPAGKRISHFKSLADNARISLLNTRLTIRALLPMPFRRHALDAEGHISMLRPLESLRLLLADRATPGQLGRSAGVAVAVSTLPLPGLQSILLLLCMGWLRLNRLCALAMVPLTWPPLLPGFCVLLGYRLRHGHWLTEFSVQTLGHEIGQRLWEWVIGSLCMAPVLGVVFGFLVWLLAWLAGRAAGGRRRAGEAG